MTPTPHAQPDLSQVHLLSLTDEAWLPTVLRSGDLALVDCIDDLCSSAMQAGSVVVILAAGLNSELKASVERIQLTLSDAAILVALPQQDVSESQCVRLIQLGVQEIISQTCAESSQWLLALRQAQARKLHETQLKRFSHYDPLTQLANRTLFQDRLEQNLIQNQRRGRGMGVLFLDLDRFPSR